MGRTRKHNSIGEEYAAFGSKIKALRMSRHLTQEQMSVIIGISKTSIVNYETGTRKVPLALIIKFAEFFHVSVDDLIGINHYSPNPEHLSRWREELENVHFSDSEIEQLIAFAKYILHRREEY